MSGPQAHWLPDGRRLHLHHGPIDMIVGIEGPGARAAYARAVARFDTLLDELVADLPRLRLPAGAPCTGETARLMLEAVAPFAPVFITPMAAVAGAGADTVLRAILDGPGISRAFVNNGGDITFHLAAGETMTAAIAGDPPAGLRIGSCDPSRGIATSGRGGRSHSFGIADSVTVLARSAAVADAAATMIANAVDLPDHPAVTRRPAIELSPDSDLGERRVTIAVGTLTDTEMQTALNRGRVYADTLRTRGYIDAACLTLRGRRVIAGALPLLTEREPHHA
ncbi:UPF0280 family protein [Roseovarius aestuariivivens]|uniref:UPF0280 family protein n=1 Tax=Roseovarius aestuariivivens TaxID=1888910 RepID=UPI0010805972|nr:UPF0280 family protein [Roseovarius aestuariivivens]